MQPLEGSDIAINTASHHLKLYGKTISGGRVAAYIRMAYSSKQGITLKVTARAEEEGVAQMVVDGVA